MTTFVIGAFGALLLVIAVVAVVILDGLLSAARERYTQLRTEMDGARVKLEELRTQLAEVTRERDQARSVCNELSVLLAESGERLFRARGGR